MNQARKRRPEEPVRVTPREFIEAWQSSASVAEVAKKTGMRKKTVRVREYRYRKAGIPLKQFEPVELPDWDELADYAASLVPEQDGSSNAQDPEREVPMEKTAPQAEGSLTMPGQLSKIEA